MITENIGRAQAIRILPVNILPTEKTAIDNKKAFSIDSTGAVDAQVLPAPGSARDEMTFDPSNWEKNQQVTLAIIGALQMSREQYGTMCAFFAQLRHAANLGEAQAIKASGDALLVSAVAAGVSTGRCRSLARV